MNEATQVFQALNSVSPLGVIAGLGYIIYLQVRNQRGQNKIAKNHLHGLPEMHEDIKDIKALLEKMSDNIVYIRARINGKDL